MGETGRRNDDVTITVLEIMEKWEIFQGKSGRDQIEREKVREEFKIR